MRVVTRRRSKTATTGTVAAGLLGGAASGAVGTAVMDLAQYARYRRGGGGDGLVDWEWRGVSGWESAPAPARAARLIAGRLGRSLPDEAANRANNVMHWSYGVAWGAAGGAVAALTGRRVAWWGPVWGTAVWLSDYVTLPLLGLYQPIWRYDASTLARDWGDHLVYGTAAGLAHRVLGPSSEAGRLRRSVGR